MKQEIIKLAIIQSLAGAESELEMKDGSKVTINVNRTVPGRGSRKVSLK